MNLFRSLTKERFDPLSLDEFVNYFTYGGVQYPTLNMSMSTTSEDIAPDFTGLAQTVYRRNGVVFACMFVRQRVFSQARFQFQQMRGGQPGDLFGTPELKILEEPWPNGTTSDLLARAITDADIAGNFFVARRGDGLQRLRPDWVRLVMGGEDPEGIDARVAGYVYFPGGAASGSRPIGLNLNEVAHFYPLPDPIAPYRGMSWLTPIIRETAADSAATQHKLKFFENAATPNLLITPQGIQNQEALDRYIDIFNKQQRGHLNAYKTLFLAGAADVTVIGKDMRQLEFKATQGAGETRIAAAAGVPPVIVGLSEGLQAATYSNYGQARRQFADATLAHLWANMAGSMAKLVTTPGGARLWYDDRHIPMLREDRKDAAEIQSVQAKTIRVLIDGGFEPESAIAAVKAEDFSRLVHTGLLSVQLQPPQTTALPPAEQAGRALIALLEREMVGNGGGSDE